MSKEIVHEGHIKTQEPGPPKKEGSVKVLGLKKLKSSREYGTLRVDRTFVRQVKVLGGSWEECENQKT